LVRERGFSCIYKKIKRRLFIHDEAVLSQIARLGAYDYLQKYKYVLNQPLEIFDAVNPCAGKIWICWLQGIAHAPHIVQKCVHSITSHHPNNEVILLDSANIPQYIAVPDYITKKWRAGIISHTHYSDIVRIFLLAKYGGVWIDATTFLFDKIPEYIRTAELFAFKCTPAAYTVASNWFMAAKPNNSVILKVKNLLCEYWKKENLLASYSIFHLFFTMAVNSTDDTKALWEAAPYFDDVNCKILQRELFDTFNPLRLEQIKQISVIQKLSYKFPQDFLDKGETFYTRIL
jgi:mannosyltransferase OCH1-like enzyme